MTELNNYIFSDGDIRKLSSIDSLKEWKGSDSIHSCAVYSYQVKDGPFIKFLKGQWDKYYLFVDGVLESSSETTDRYTSSFTSQFRNFEGFPPRTWIIGGGDLELFYALHDFMGGDFDATVIDPLFEDYLKIPAIHSCFAKKYCYPSFLPAPSFDVKPVVFDKKTFNYSPYYKPSIDLIVVDVSDNTGEGSSSQFYNSQTSELILSALNSDGQLLAYDPDRFFQNCPVINSELKLNGSISYYDEVYKHVIVVNSFIRK